MYISLTHHPVSFLELCHVHFEHLYSVASKKQVAITASYLVQLANQKQSNTCQLKARNSHGLPQSIIM